MLHSVVLTVDPAWPPVSGAELRNWQNALALARLGPVQVVSVHDAPGRSKPPFGMRCTSLGVAPGSTPPPATAIEPHLAADTAQRLRRMLVDARADLLVVEGAGLVPLAATVRETVPRIVLDMHNVESRLAAAIATTAPWWKRIAAVRRVRRIRRLELAGAAMADQIWVCARTDADRLDEAIRRPVHIIPNAIPAADRLPAELPPEAPRTGGPRLLFVGHLGYPPNVLAAVRLATGILPAVRRSAPDATLILAGRNPSHRVTNLTDASGVTLLPDPPDVTALLAEAELVVVPLTIGGGTRLKVLEAMAHGVPVVATRLAVEGLDLAPGVHYQAGETDAELAAAVLALAGDRERRNAIRAAAFRHVRNRFAPGQIERAVAFALA